MLVRRRCVNKARADLFRADNPSENVAGNQHWGHATSTDLYHWENQAIAIYPGAEGEGIFSGSSVIDVNNTSGFFPNQTDGVVAIYTLNTAEEETQEVRSACEATVSESCINLTALDCLLDRRRLYLYEVRQQPRYIHQQHTVPGSKGNLVCSNPAMGDGHCVCPRLRNWVSNLPP